MEKTKEFNTLEVFELIQRDEIKSENLKEILQLEIEKLEIFKHLTKIGSNSFNMNISIKACLEGVCREIESEINNLKYCIDANTYHNQDALKLFTTDYVVDNSFIYKSALHNLELRRNMYIKLIKYIKE